MGTFESFYGSFLQQPVTLWVAAGAGLAVVATRRSISASTRAFCLGFGLLPFVDAWLTADDVAPFGALPPAAASVAGILFAILGDYRVFLFLEAATDRGEIPLDRGSALRASLWSLVVPVASAVAHALLPDRPSRARATFLVYELSFLALLFVRSRLARRPAGEWTSKVTGYVYLYYALWAAADVLILGFDLDVGYLVRTAANLLYYGGLLAMISVTAPRPARGT
jgi:hypothetical protein